MSEQASRWLQPQHSSHLNWNPRHWGAETSPPYFVQTPGLPCAGQTPCLAPAQKSINKRCKFTWMYMVMCLMPSNLRTVSSLRSHTWLCTFPNLKILFGILPVSTWYTVEAQLFHTFINGSLWVKLLHYCLYNSKFCSSLSSEEQILSGAFLSGHTCWFWGWLPESEVQLCFFLAAWFWVS